MRGCTARRSAVCSTTSCCSPHGRKATPNNERINCSFRRLVRPPSGAAPRVHLAAWFRGGPAIQPARKQVSVFNTEEKREDDRDTEKQGFWRFAQECGHAPREAPKLVFSVYSVVLPLSSVLKTLA